jgi:adenosylcobyric acid synthase
VIGTYLHGLFDNPPVRRSILGWAARRRGLVYEQSVNPTDDREAGYDRLAAVLRASLDIPLLYRLIGLPTRVD